MIHLIRAEIERLILAIDLGADPDAYEPGLPYRVSPSTHALDLEPLPLGYAAREIQVAPDLPVGTDEHVLVEGACVDARIRVLVRYCDAGWRDAWTRLRTFASYDAGRIVAAVQRPPAAATAWAGIAIMGAPVWVPPGYVREATAPGCWVLDLLFGVLYRQV